MTSVYCSCPDDSWASLLPLFYLPALLVCLFISYAPPAGILRLHAGDCRVRHHRRVRRRRHARGQARRHVWRRDGGQAADRHPRARRCRRRGGRHGPHQLQGRRRLLRADRPDLPRTNVDAPPWTWKRLGRSSPLCASRRPTRQSPPPTLPRTASAPTSSRATRWRAGASRGAWPPVASWSMSCSSRGSTRRCRQGGTGPRASAARAARRGCSHGWHRLK